MAFVMVGFIAGGGGLAFASERSLPGDILYPIKTNITEEVVASFQSTPEAKIAWEEKRVERRSVESLLLNQRGDLGEEEARIIINKIEESHDRIDRQIIALSEDLSFDNVEFSSTENPTLATAQIMVAESGLPTISDLGVESEVNTFRNDVELELEGEEPKSIEIKDLPITIDEIKPESTRLDNPTLRPTEFGEEALKKLYKEIDRLSEGGSLDKRLEEKLNNLMEIAKKHLGNKDTLKFFQTIREIKSILES